MPDVTLRNGLLDGKMLEEMRRPFELDLEAVFKMMLDQMIREVLKAAGDGSSPEDLMIRIDLLFEEGEGG